MKTSAKISVQKGIFKVSFDLFEAVWDYLLYDNISLLADYKKNNIKLFSFFTGKEKTMADISKDNLEELSKSQLFELNYSLGDIYTTVYKKDSIDITGKFIEAIDAQFLNRNQTAIECYKNVIETNPNNYRAYNLLGRCFRNEGNLDKAYECYQKAIELSPDSPEIHCNLGVLFQKEGKEDNAQTEFSKAIELDNFYCNALVKRAEWLLNNDPENKELAIYNLRISAVHQDVTSAQNYLKEYYEKNNLNRNSYTDKEIAIFNDFADYKIQKKLKIIESAINNGAFGYALKNITEILDKSSETSAKNIIATWCNNRAQRCVKRLSVFSLDNLINEYNNIIKSTPAQQEDFFLNNENKRVVNRQSYPKTNIESPQREETSPKEPVHTKDQYATPIDTKSISLNSNYKSPVKGVNPLTVQEFFMIVLFEVMRDGEIAEAEKKFLADLKNQLKISGKDYSKMYYHIKEQITKAGVDKPTVGEFNTKRVFKNICKAAWRDGILEESEKKILLYARKIFNITEQEFKDFLYQAKQQAYESKN